MGDDLRIARQGGRAKMSLAVRGWITPVLVALALTGYATGAAAAEYIGNVLTEVKAEDRVTIAHPQPVQLLFVFQTKGAPNARATKFLKQQVFDTVKASGLFSEVSEAPTANGAILSVVIDNVVAPKEMKDAEAKGMVTGATFFIAGSNVVDHYISTVDYVGGPTAPKMTKTAQQVLITQMGLINSAPTGAVKIGSIKDALAILVKQIVGNPLNDLGKEPGFQVPDAGATASPAAASPSAPAPTTAPAAPVAAPAAPATTPAAEGGSAAPAAHP